MGLSFLSLLYLQVSYIEEMVKMRREQFEENVGRSLAQAVHNLELVETKSIWRRMWLLPSVPPGFPVSFVSRR